MLHEVYMLCSFVLIYHNTFSEPTKHVGRAGASHGRPENCAEQKKAASLFGRRMQHGNREILA